jgi:2-polyprenyl-6-methoxyphenol hydroxylase-like FAD-dependent oxidoreductase
MGIEKSFRSNLAPEQGIQMVDSSGRRRAYFPANKPGGKGPQNFTTEYEIMRGDFCQLLHSNAKDKVTYHFSKSVDTYSETPEGLQVRFSDSTTEEYDLLVGADGQYSRIRRLMLGLENPDALIPLKGLYIAYFTIPKPIQPGEEYIATSYLATDRRGIMTRRQNPDTLQVYLGGRLTSSRLRNARRGDIQEEKNALAEIFEGAGWKTKEIVEAMMGADNFYCERMGVVKLKPGGWGKGKVALVGDAAWCPTANTGMGTTCAIVGAYILAGEISKHVPVGRNGKKDVEEGLKKAFAGYEDKFRPFMEQVQKGVEEPSKYPESKFAIGVLNRVMGVLSLLRVNVGKWMLKEDVKGWELPEYEGLR